MTPFDEIVGIAAVAWRADACTVLTDRSGSAFYVAATVYALALHAGVVERTRDCLAAGAGGRVGARTYLDLLTANEGIAEESFLAATIVATDGVDADRVATTCVSIALVDV